MGLFLGAVPALDASGVGMNPQGLSQWGAELLGLDERAHDRSQLLDARPLREASQRLLSWPAGAHFQVHAEEFFVERALLLHWLIGDPSDGGIEAQSGLDTHHEQVEDVRESVDDLSAAYLDAVVEPEVRKEEADHAQDQRDRHQSRERYGLEGHEAVEEVERAQPSSEGDLGAEEEQDRPGLVEASPDEPATVLCRSGVLGAADRPPDLLDGVLPPGPGFVGPAQDGRRTRRRRRSRPAEALALEGWPEAHQGHAGKQGHARDEHEGEDGDGEGAHGCLTP